MSETVLCGDVLLATLALLAPKVLDNARREPAIRFIAVDGNGGVYGYAAHPVNAERLSTWGPDNIVSGIEIQCGYPEFLERKEPPEYHKYWREMIAEIKK